jgi:tRNA (Thr-GGU) A37 N-methylase
MSNNKQYIIVDITSKEFFKDVNGKVKIFDDYDDALLHCGIYEFENAWVCELKHNHIEDNEQAMIDYNKMEEEWEMDNYNEIKDEQQ